MTTSVPYSTLKPAQRKQAAYLFADEAFGTDASAYLYELDKSGVITGRKSLANVEGRRSRKVTQTEIRIRPLVNVSAGQVRAAQMHMDALSASIAETVYQHQLEEVTP